MTRVLTQTKDQIEQAQAHRTPTRADAKRDNEATAATAGLSRRTGRHEQPRAPNGTFMSSDDRNTSENRQSEEFTVRLPTCTREEHDEALRAIRRLEFTNAQQNRRKSTESRVVRPGFARRTGQTSSQSRRRRSQPSGGPNDPGDEHSSDSDDENEARPNRRRRNQFIPIPIPIPASISSIIDMTRWAVAVTPSRMKFFYWISLLIMKCLCFITNLLFWACAFMTLKTLPTWTGLMPFLSGIWWLRPEWLGGAGIQGFGEMWRELFTEDDLLNSPSLQLVLYETGVAGSPVMNMITIPVLLGNPIFWMTAMLIMFLIHNTLTFICGCLEESDRKRIECPLCELKGD